MPWAAPKNAGATNAPAPTAAPAPMPPLINAGRAAARSAVPAVALTAPRRVVLLLPLSGPHAELGQHMVQAVQLAVQDLAPNNFMIVPADTAQGAANSLQQAMAAAETQPADLVIGPLFSADVAATKTLASRAGVPMLAFSNDLTQADGNTFLMGSGPAEQMQRVLEFAARQNVLRVVALLPDNAYGQAINQLLPNLMNPPQSLVQVIKYQPQNINMAQVVARLQADVNSYDAVLLPDAPVRAGAIAAALRAAGVLQNERGAVRLLGSSQWDQGWDNSETPATALAALHGGWFAAPDPAARDQFSQRYLRSFGTAPPALASLAYDATALAAALASRNWPYSVEALTQSQGFAGMGGVFRLQRNGTVERALAIQELSPSGRRILEAAPARF